MIRLLTSSTQDILAFRLAQELKTQPRHIFKPTFILTPGIVQDNWLKEYLATELGIVANLKLQKPDRFFGWLEYLFSGLSVNDKFSSDQLVWVVFGWMGEEDFRKKFQKLDTYYGTDEVKRLALAQKLVRLLDKYQDFRQEMISSWNNPDSDDWQEYLFVRLKIHLNSKFPDKTQRIQIIQEALKLESNRDLLKKEVGILYVFGSVSMTPGLLDLLALAGQFIPVYIFRSDLGILDSQSSIAANWGNSIKNTLQELLKLQGIEREKLGETAQTSNLLLSQVQKSIQFNSPILITDPNLEGDLSFEFHSCHTRIREVESFYNYLIRLGESRGDLRSRQCLVFVPSLDQYVGPIKTVFDSAPKKFRYQFVTGAYSREESFWSALNAVLAFKPEDFTAPKFFQLIEMNAIREGLGFQDLGLLRKMIAKAGICRDYEGKLDLETRYQSWEYGLKRLMYGFLLGKDDLLYSDGTDEFYTCDAVEGNQADELIRLITLTSLIQGILKEKGSKKLLKDWLAMTSQLAEELLKPLENEFVQLQRLVAQFGISEELESEPIEFKTFFYRFSDLLNSMEIHRIKGFGGITFSEMAPGSVFPAKVVAFMGMNFGEFPRKDSPVSFDKMNSGEKHCLYPNSRITDQGVFLEALIHAGESVFISYLGQSDKDNKELPASTLVEELLDLISGNTGVEREDLIIKHPLQSESGAYNQNGCSKLKNFLIRQEKPLDLQKQDQEEESVSINNHEIRLSDLELFFRDPLKHYYNRILGIYYGDRSESLKESELFGLDNLEKWSIKDHLLFSNPGNGLENLRSELTRKGMLPLRNSGIQELQSLIEEMNGIWDFFSERGRPEKRTFTVMLDGNISISGDVFILPDGSGVYYTVSKDNPKYPNYKYRISALIHFLLLRESGNSDPFYYVTLEGVFKIWVNFDLEKTKADLIKLVSFYSLNRKRKIPFCSESTQKINTQKESRSEEGFIEALDNAMETRETSHFFPSDYFVKEYETDFFENDAVLKELFDNHDLINKILESYFA